MKKHCSDKLNLLIDSINKFDNANIAESAKAIYSYKTVGQQFFDIYKKVLEI